MQTGWNSQVVCDDLPQQTIDYLLLIDKSPTALNGVLETMNRSLQITDECQQQFLVVTYDLAIAKQALTLQTEESPQFDRLFIMLGGSNICTVFFKALGKYMEDSGAAYVLGEAGVLADR